MSIHLFEYADGRREFRDVDAEQHVVYQLFDPPTPTRRSLSWSEFATLADPPVPIRNFRRTEYRYSPDFHGPLESPSWEFVMGPAYDASHPDRKLLRYRREYRYIET